MTRLHGLLSADVDRLRNALNVIEQDPGSAAGQVGDPRFPHSRIDRHVFGVLTSAIGAASSSGNLPDPTTGELNVYRVTSTGGTADTGDNIGVYDLSGIGATTTEWVRAIRIDGSDNWILDRRPIQRVFGALTNAISPTTPSLDDPSTGELTIYNITSTGGTSASTETIPVYDLSQTGATTGEWLTATRHGDKWVLERPENPRRIFGALTSAITGTTGLLANPKTGTLEVYSLTSTGGTTNTGRTQTVYHFSMVDATTDRWVGATKDMESGNWVLDYFACT
jgi:hypothetical protein